MSVAPKRSSAKSSRPRAAPDQARRLRELAQTARRSATTIAIVSGKGGVGKTNIAVNLAICLSERVPNIALVDADLGLANADLLFGITPKLTLAHVIAGRRTIDEISIAAPGGVRFVPGASGLHDLANLSTFERQSLLSQLQSLERSADMVVLDCGAGLSSSVIGFALSADIVMVVTTPEPTALTDAYATIKSLRRERCEARVGVFVNRADSRAHARATFERIANVSRRFLDYSVADLGFMLQDTNVEAAVRARSPFVIAFPSTTASACIAATARNLAGSSAQERRGGFFRRVAGLFL